MSAKGLGVNGLKVDGIDDTNALSAIDTIKEAMSINMMLKAEHYLLQVQKQKQLKKPLFVSLRGTLEL